MSNNLHTACIFFDIEKAFDKICAKTIIQALDQLKINGNTRAFITQFLNNRTSMFASEITSQHQETRNQARHRAQLYLLCYLSSP